MQKPHETVIWVSSAQLPVWQVYVVWRRHWQKVSFPEQPPIVWHTRPSRLRLHEGCPEVEIGRVPEQVPFEQVCCWPLRVPVLAQKSAYEQLELMTVPQSEVVFAPSEQTAALLGPLGQLVMPARQGAPGFPTQALPA
jgi:hypothetical protein